MLYYVSTFRMNAESSQPLNVRKSSFLCYVSMITIIKKLKPDKPTDYTDILDKIIHNILQSFKDDEPKIVHAGAECLYNTINYYRESVLPNFNSYLEGLICLMTINDPEVKEIAQNLDSILKGVISYTFQGQLPDNFNLLNFFKIIIEKIQLKHPDIKRNIVSWISWINQIPEMKLINVLQMFLPELFNMLSDNNNDVQKSAEDCLQDFYDEIESEFETLSYEVEVNILEILIKKCTNTDQKTQSTALKWILLFLKKYSFLFIQSSKTKNQNKTTMIKNSTSTKTLNLGSGATPAMLTPKESLFEIDTPKIEELSLNNANSFVDFERKYPFPLFSKILEIVILSSKISNDEIKKFAKEINESLLIIMKYLGEFNSNIKLFEEVLTKNFTEKDETILNLIFEWVNKLFNKFHEDSFSNFNVFVSKFTQIICHESEAIFEKVMQTLCIIAKYKEEYADIVINNLIEQLSKEDNLLAKRGDVIVNKLCGALKVEKVYSTFANVLLNLNEYTFVCKILNKLELFLLKEKEADELRCILRKVKGSGNNAKEKAFFEKLFRTWCISPVSILYLCLIAEYFELSYFLLLKL